MISTSFRASLRSRTIIFIFKNTPFGSWFLNSLITSSLVTVSVLFFDSLIGYTLAKFTFRGRNLVFIAILTTLMIPTEMLDHPWYLMAKNFGWLNTYWGIMFPGHDDRVRRLPDAPVLRRAFRTTIFTPRESTVSSEFQIWWKVAMPLVTPALSALAIFTFLGNWTAFLWPLIATNDRGLYTLPVGLASFSGEYLTEWELDHGRRHDCDDPDACRLHHFPTLHHPRRRSRRV